MCMTSLVNCYLFGASVFHSLFLFIISLFRFELFMNLKPQHCLSLSPLSIYDLVYMYIYILLCVYNDPAGGIIAYFNTIHSIRMNKLNKRVKKTEQSFEEKKKR